MHAGLDEPLAGEVRPTSRSRLSAMLGAIDAEYFVVDLGAGASRTLLDFFLGAHVALFVTTPEPTAIESTYRFVRAAYARHLRASAPDSETRRRIVERLRAMGNSPAPLDLGRRLEAAGDPLADLVRAAMDAFTFRFVLNQTRLRADLEVGDAMRSAVRRRFGLDVSYLGYVDYDDTVWTCVRMRRPLLVESPGTKAAKSIEKIARRLINIDQSTREVRRVRAVPPESHHDLLEVDRGATDEEIRRAYKRAKEIYAPNALACYGLFDDASMESLRARLEEAYDVLLDPARRRPYELSVFPPDPEPVPAPAHDEDEEPKPPPPVITPDTEFTGPLLRAVRESQGVDLRDVSQRTKVGRAYLEAIERDDFTSLPAPVYVRGFVTELAKCLRLDAAQVSRTYVRRYKRHLDGREKAV
jgi:flagellar biosynthesis protein FlhG